MANLLDELTGPVNNSGRDTHVIDVQLPVEVGFGSTLFQIALWVCGIIPGLIFLYMKTKARNYFQQLEQTIQAEASNIDNYIEQRVIIMQDIVGIVERATTLDKEVYTQVAALRSGIVIDNANRSDINQQLNIVSGRLFPQVEAYPELKSQQTLADAMQHDSYLQREITAARTVYNNRVNQWNRDIFDWPTKQIVAAEQHYTTRIPFSTSHQTIERSKVKFF